MAQQVPPIRFEDIPLTEARRMSRGPRMEFLLYDTLRTRIQSLSDQGTRIHLGQEIAPQWMRIYPLRIARELGVSVTIRRVLGGLLFWRSTEEDILQAKEVSARLQSARQPRQATHRGRRRS